MEHEFWLDAFHFGTCPCRGNLHLQEVLCLALVHEAHCRDVVGDVEGVDRVGFPHGLGQVLVKGEQLFRQEGGPAVFASAPFLQMVLQPHNLADPPANTISRSAILYELVLSDSSRAKWLELRINFGRLSVNSWNKISVKNTAFIDQFSSNCETI